jgi:hypothetical protein
MYINGDFMDEIWEYCESFYNGIDTEDTWAEKENNLNLQKKSLLFENRSEFEELLSYYCKLADSIYYQN